MMSRLFGRLLRRSYPWLPLLLLGSRTLIRLNASSHRDRLRCWWLLYRIDFANLLAIAMEMIQPEYWLF
jgi:hypothetical protein